MGPVSHSDLQSKGWTGGWEAEWDSGIGRVGGQQTSSVIEVCEVWVFLQPCIFSPKFLKSVVPVPASPSTKRCWKKPELQTSHSTIGKAHKDNIHVKSDSQETLKEACVQSKAVKLGSM